MKIRKLTVILEEDLYSTQAISITAAIQNLPPWTKY